jgi:adenine specific DNA methylase Mod
LLWTTFDPLCDTTANMPDNALYYGDNLDILKRHIKDDAIDLVYLDPPFNSNATYNVLFAEQDGTKAGAQIKAFEDTWQWDQEAARAYHQIVESGGQIAQTMIAFRTILGDSNMLAYLAMMAPRLLELHRALKDTGSIYLHCDPTSSHYLKLLMDAIFGPVRFRNEIAWKRTTAHSDARQGRKAYGNVMDTLLFYPKTDEYYFSPAALYRLSSFWRFSCKAPISS